MSGEILSAKWIALWWLQSTALLGVAGLCAQLRLTPSVRRALWLSAIGGSALLATQPLWVPTLMWLGWTNAAAQASALSFDVPLIIDGSVHRSASDAMAWSSIAVILWAAVSLVLLARQAIAHLRVWRFVRRARPVAGALADRIARDDTSRIRVLPSDHHGPFTAGVFSSTVYLPAGADAWSEQQLHAVLTHELTHVEQRDCLAQLVADVHAAVAWPNPAAWWARAAIAHERELIADEHVLAHGMRSEDYAEVLVRLASRHAWLAAAAMAKPSTLTTRIETMLQPRATLSRWHLVLAVCLLAFTGIAAACANGAGDTNSASSNGTGEPLTIDLRGAPGSEDNDSEPTGNLEPELIRIVMNEAKEELKDCYETEVERTRYDLPVTIKVHFTIGVDGHPRDVTSNHISAMPALAPCMQRAISALHFPKPEGGGEVVVNYPFKFTSNLGDHDVEPREPDNERLLKEQVLKEVKRVSGTVSSCIGGLGEGKLVMKWLISPRGTVSDISLDRLTLKAAPGAPIEKLLRKDSEAAHVIDEAAYKCIEDALKNMQFPKSSTSTPVTFPFVIR